MRLSWKQLSLNGDRGFESLSLRHLYTYKYMPKHRRRTYVIKFFVTLCNLFLFNYLIIYADKFQVSLDGLPVKANFVETTRSEDNIVAVTLDNIIIDDSKVWGNITYVIKPGDTLSSIAQAVWTTVANIRRVNNLWSDVDVLSNATVTNKDGIAINKLTISELPGIIVAMNTKTSVTEFANQYWLNEDDIKALNNISDSKTILHEGDELFLTISEQDAIKKWILEDPNPPVIEKPILAIEENKKPTSISDKKDTSSNNKKSETTKKTTTISSVPKKAAQIVSTAWAGTNGIVGYDKWSIISSWFQKDRGNFWFAAGYCTSYAASKRPDIFKNPDKTFRGNAGAWYANAKKAGNKVGSQPKAGAIIVFAPGRWASWYGHVWYVEEVDGDKVVITDMNYKWRNIVTKRVVDADLALWYIY